MCREETLKDPGVEWVGQDLGPNPFVTAQTCKVGRRHGSDGTGSQAVAETRHPLAGGDFICAFDDGESKLRLLDVWDAWRLVGGGRTAAALS